MNGGDHYDRKEEADDCYDDSFYAEAERPDGKYIIVLNVDYYKDKKSTGRYMKKVLL